MVNTLRPRQNGRLFADDIFKCIFLNENVWISIKISLKFVPKGLINNIPALVQIMAWHRLGDKPLSEPMMVSLPTHICVTRPQWVNKNNSQFQWLMRLVIRLCVIKLGPVGISLMNCLSISDLCHHWFKLLLVTCLAPSYFPNQCWQIIDYQNSKNKLDTCTCYFYAKFVTKQVLIPWWKFIWKWYCVKWPRLPKP